MNALFRTIAITCAVLPASPALAEKNWAIGGSLSVLPVGSSNGVGFDDLCARFESTSCLGNNIGGKLHLTYDANAYAAFELSWIHLEQDTFGTDSTEFNVTGPAIAVMPMFPLYPEAPDSGMEFFGKIGMYNWDFSGTTDDGSGTKRFSTTGTDRFIGVGTRIRILSFGARLEVEQFEVDGDDVLFFSLGLSYRF